MGSNLTISRRKFISNASMTVPSLKPAICHRVAPEPFRYTSALQEDHLLLSMRWKRLQRLQRIHRSVSTHRLFHKVIKCINPFFKAVRDFSYRFGHRERFRPYKDIMFTSWRRVSVNLWESVWLMMFINLKPNEGSSSNISLSFADLIASTFTGCVAMV